jgi:hypothetical protein
MILKKIYLGLLYTIAFIVIVIAILAVALLIETPQNRIINNNYQRASVEYKSHVVDFSDSWDYSVLEDKC